VEFVRSAAKTYSRRHPGGIRLQSGDELYRVRIGDLRLLFSVEDQILLVLIVKIWVSW